MTIPIFPFLKKRISPVACFLFLTLLSATKVVAGHYEHFKVSVYARAYEVEKMADEEWLADSWQTISSQLNVDKIYLETHRDLKVVDDATLESAKAFFESKGIEVAGGITYTINESNLFETYCYSNPDHLAKARDVIEHTARHFDEIILDDFFFTSCKCELCIAAKGDRSWTDYRLEIMNRAAREWILGPAKAVNAAVRVIIKYPNWYEHFQGLGFDLEHGPTVFDGIYTGTETRDAVLSNQHLQPYHGFLILRYFSHLAPGRNGGGWVDPFASSSVDRYAEQLLMTLLAKAPEMTLFDYRMMLAPADRLIPSPWEVCEGTWNHAEMEAYQPAPLAAQSIEPITYARAAGYALDKIDASLPELGEPLALPSYKPFHSTGEDFLQSFVGMMGIPIRLVSRFPEDADIQLLTASAAEDPELVERIEAQLRKGKQVIITSGLLKKLQDQGLDQIAEIRLSERKAMGKDFLVYRHLENGEKRILFPQLEYLTNDSWPAIEVVDGDLGWPILHFAPYADGRLWVWVVPDNFSDLYHLPESVLNGIRELTCKSLGIWMQGPAKVSLFPYDNRKLVVTSFADVSTTVRLLTEDLHMRLCNAVAEEALKSEVLPERSLIGSRRQVAHQCFELTLPPHSFVVLEW